MEATEKRVVVVLADISGYTQFMVENQMSAIHGQQCITYLIETLIREIDIPLRLQEIEGDALFLYAEDPGSDEAWQIVLTQIPQKLLRFFDAFYDGAVLAMEATPCKCAICRNSRELALKIIVHSGTAVFHQIGGFNKVSGPDVILAHRLLKNTVPDNEYLLMSEAAHRDIGQKMDGPFLEGRESYDSFGDIKTFVRYNRDIKEKRLDALYKQPPATMALRAGGYALVATAGLFPAMLKELRSPTNKTSLIRRIGFSLLLVLRAPVMIMMYMFGAPRRLFGFRNDRAQLREGKTESS
jgi:class 3 adenylate cyclase